jgi:hypothetical protein
VIARNAARQAREATERRSCLLAHGRVLAAKVAAERAIAADPFGAVELLGEVDQVEQKFRAECVAPRGVADLAASLRQATRRVR